MSDIEEALLILQEECAEVIHISNKALRFGLKDIHPITRIQNRDALVQEIGDVIAIVDVLISLKVLTEAEIQFAKAKKIEKLKIWSCLFSEVKLHD